LLIVNPKRENESIEVKPYWYNYYAGYSHTFTQKIIESADLPDSAVLLDPWNGGGTTTLMASVNGFCSIGVDLNPVMKVIASAKQTVKSDINIINQKLKEISGKVKPLSINNDHLNVWFDPFTVETIRKIEYCIIGEVEYESTIDKVNALTNAQCLMYTGLFNCVRSYLSGFIPSNPTWVKKPKCNEEKVSVSWVELKKQYIRHVKDMVKGISIADHQWPKDTADIKVGSSSQLPIESSSIDFVLTSPPYCTRIDYGIATLPELSILCVGGEKEIDLIRRQLMGTTTVPKEVESGVEKLTGKCVSFLESVRKHSSKASKTYYYKNLSQYFLSLDASMNEIDRVMKPGSVFICVVQDSFYKDIHCDLPEIMSETAESRKLKLREIIEFESKRNMANLNIKSKQYRRINSAFESVLIFDKGE
jgi:DNA modification methylase